MTEQRECIAAQPLPTVVIELGRLLERRLHGKVIGHEVTANQFMALIRIANSPGLSRADLARGMQVTPRAVGVLTAQLLDKGLISRTANRPGLPMELALTESGYQIVKLSRSKLEAVTEEMLRFFRPNLAVALDGALRHLLVHLD
jgi:DNA-binding MarR family transcriptional regulator